MKIDYSFPQIFFETIKEKNTSEEFLAHPVAEVLLKEKPVGNLADTDEKKKIITFENAVNKEDAVMNVLNELIANENHWTGEVREHMGTLFPESSIENVEIYFTVGSEIEIKNSIHINLDNEYFFVNYKKVIPEIIYRLTLHLYTRKHPYKIAFEHLKPSSYMDFVHYLIHYNGAGAYSADRYIETSSFDYSQSVFCGDKNSRKELSDSYNSLSEKLKGGVEVELLDFLKKSSLPQKIGGHIFKGAILSGKKFEEMLSIPFTEFIDAYLPPILSQNIEMISTGPLSEESAKEISTWKYPSEYSVYDLPDWNEMSKHRWAITFKEKRDKEFIGFFIKDSIIGFGQIVKKPKENTIGLGIRPDLCGYGCGTKVVGILLDECQKRNPDIPIVLEVMSSNKRAINCYKKFGFKETASYKTYSISGKIDFVKMEFNPTDLKKL